VPLKVRSLVGLMPLLAVEVLEHDQIKTLPGFQKRMNWFLKHRKDLADNIAYMEAETGDHGHRLLAIPTRDRLVRVLKYMLDENEFLSPHGIRAVSKIHEKQPYIFRVNGEEFRVDYTPAESNTGLFGGNSNWRGPIWMPINYLLVEALERYHHFYGDDLKVECPTGSGNRMNLGQVADELSRRLASIFLPGHDGRRPCHGAEARYANDPHWKDLVLFYEYFHGDTGRGVGAEARYANDPHWKDLVLFYEYFHGDTGRGVGATHQTGWTALAARCIENVVHRRAMTTNGSATAHDVHDHTHAAQMPAGRKSRKSTPARI
jgi:hypothetical protein